MKNVFGCLYKLTNAQLKAVLKKCSKFNGADEATLGEHVFGKVFASMVDESKNEIGGNWHTYCSRRNN